MGKFLLALMVILFALALIKTASAEKPPVISPPLQEPLPLTPSKGSYGAGDTNALLLAPEAADWLSDANASGLIVVVWPAYSDGEIDIDTTPSVAYLTDPEFAATHISVQMRENCCRPWLDVPITINGVVYQQRGCMQLLLDSSMLRLINEMNGDAEHPAWYGNITTETIRDCAINTMVAEQWWLKTNNGRPWRLWTVKPLPGELTDGNDDGLMGEDRWWESRSKP